MFLRAEGDWDSAAEKAKYGFTQRCLEVEKQVPYDARGPLTQALVRDQEKLSGNIASLREAFVVTLTALRTSMETAARDANEATWDRAVADAQRKVDEAIDGGKKAIATSIADRTDSFSELAATASKAASKAEGEKAAMGEQLQADKERLSGLGDIRQLTSVAPQDAAALVRYYRDGSGFSGGQTIDLESLAELAPAVAKELSACTTGLVLPAVTRLSPESAKHLARMTVDKRNRLVLRNLQSLDSADLAAALARNKELELPHLKQLSPQVAASLTAFEGYLDLRGIEGLSPEAADALADCKGTLSLDGLLRLESPRLARKLGSEKSVSMNHLTLVSDEAAAALCSGEATLFLPRLARLTSAPLAARLLARMEEGGSDFGAVEEISPDAAVELAKHSEPLRFAALRSLDAETAAALTSHKAHVEFSVLKHLDREAGDALARHPGNIYLPQLMNLLSAELAKKLIEDGERQFNQIQAITPEVARVFADRDIDFGHRIDLSGLTALSPEAARPLIEVEGCLVLNGLTEMPLPLAQVLSRFAGERLELEGVRSMSKQSQEALGSVKGRVQLAPQDVISSRSTTFLDQVTSAKAITREVAAAVAKRDDRVALSVTELPPDVAEALSDYVGDELILNSVRTLQLESAKHLGRMRLRRLELNALDELPASVAAALLRLGPSHALTLKGLTTLDKDTAFVLAQCVGEVDLRGLKSLDAAAAAALAKKGDMPRQHGLNLDGLSDLSPEAARGLSRYRGDLRLPGITTITADVAEAFASHKGGLMLGITSIDDESIEWLSKHRDGVAIYGVRGLTRKQFDRIEAAGNMRHFIERKNTRRVENPD